MTDIDREEAEQVLERAKKAAERPRLDGETLDRMDELVGELRDGLEENGFEEPALELRSVLDDISESILHGEPEMDVEEERGAREEGPREEEYGDR